jgi:hypothetical protein
MVGMGAAPVTMVVGRAVEGVRRRGPRLGHRYVKARRGKRGEGGGGGGEELLDGRFGPWKAGRGIQRYTVLGTF